MTDSTKKKAWYRQPEMIIGLSALTVSLVAVFVGVYSAVIDRAFARASVWPRLEIYRSFSIEPTYFKYTVTNSGTGPAIVQYASVSIDGELKGNWRDLVAEFHDGPAPFIQSHIGSRTLVAERTFEILSTTDPELARAFRKNDSDRIEIELCYCSIYDECWRIDRRNVPEEVKRCEIREEDRFQQ